MAEEIVDAEVLDDIEARLPAVREHPVTLFGTDDPVAVVQQAERVASALADVIDQKGLFKQIGAKKHVLVEGWTLLGSMLGVFPVTEWTRPLQDANGQPGWEARVLAVTRSGEVVGTREAMCSRSEQRWAKADDYAIRSMAQTRAVSGALSSPLRFIMELAGYSGTPEAEMHTAGSPEVRVEPQTPVPHSYAELEELWTKQYLDMAWIEEAAEEWKRQHDGSKAGLMQALAHVCARLVDEGPAGPVGHTQEQIQQAFAAVLDGVILEGPPAISQEQLDEWSRKLGMTVPGEEDIPFGEEGDPDEPSDGRDLRGGRLL